MNKGNKETMNIKETADKIEETVDINETADTTKFNYKFSNEIKTKMDKIYEDMVKKLDSSIFNELFLNNVSYNKASGIGSNNSDEDQYIMKIDESMTSLLKTTLLENLKRKLDNVWSVHNIQNNLEILNLLKEKYKTCKTQQWRPFGKTADQQLIAYRVKILNARILFFENQLRYQNEKIQFLFTKLDENVEILNEVSKRREKLQKEIDLQEETLLILRKKVRDLRLKIIDHL